MCHPLSMKKDQLPMAKKLRERAHELKLKADHFIKEADALIAKAEEIEKKTTMLFAWRGRRSGIARRG
jgi:hypothetical protein